MTNEMEPIRCPGKREGMESVLLVHDKDTFLTTPSVMKDTQRMKERRHEVMLAHTAGSTFG
jgi:hypothetical protein